MKNPSEVITGVVLLGLCAIGAASTSRLPPPIRTDAVGPAYLPTATLILTEFCSLLLIVFGIRNRPVKNLWGERKHVSIALLFFIAYVVFLFAMCSVGNIVYDLDDPPFRHGVGFAVSNAVFLYVACRCLGRTNQLELLLVSVGSTALLVIVFSVFFKVLLP